MAKVSNITRNFSLQYIYMYHTATLMYINYLIDQEDFHSVFPIFTVEYGENFLNKMNEVKNYVNDINTRHEIGVFVANAERIKEEAMMDISILLFYAKVAFGNNKALLRQFGKGKEYAGASKNYYRMEKLLLNDYELCLDSDYKSQLNNVGYSQERIDELFNRYTELRNALNIIEKAKANRVMNTSNRNNAFNELWKIMAEISVASKTVYKNNPGKREMYLLYKGKKKKKKDKDE